MKDTWENGKKLPRNGRKTASYYSASFPPHNRRTLLSTLVSFSVVIVRFCSVAKVVHRSGLNVGWILIVNLGDIQ